MCLDRPANKDEVERCFKPFRDGNHQVGSKWFYAGNRAELMGLLNTKPCERWIHEEKWRASPNNSLTYNFGSDPYPKGFHIYHDPDCIEGNTKVYYRGVVARGYQDGVRVVVAKEIFITQKYTSRRHSY